MDNEHFIGQALDLTPNTIAYRVSEYLHAARAGEYVLEAADSPFDIEGYAAAGLCELAAQQTPFTEIDAHWRGPEEGVGTRLVQSLFHVVWQGNHLDVLLLQWNEGMSSSERHWIIGESRALAEAFFAAVCQWATELREEILVFDSGHWHKDEALFHAIKTSTLDNLVLRGQLKQEIHADLQSFFQARDTYAQYGVPWKRGILFVGPPGNGKTHAVKALVNALGQDCLYVKSFRGMHVPDEFCIREVFDRARATTPCILVLEDLDSLVTPQNRSFFLNELDGFAGNTGILTLATTNHPERLDPAILNRPSRFDRKYPFDLPAVEERRVYIHQWNQTLQPALRLSDEGITGIAEATEEFSFAYLKELFLSATMQWIGAAQPGSMDEIMTQQVDVLRDQMASAIVLSDELSDADLGDGGGFVIPHGLPARGYFSYQAAIQRSRR
jgi:AAA+ superfamily predicted ATPase